MKSLQGAASVDVPADIERCRSLLAAVEQYPAWYPDVVRAVEVLERRPDGSAAMVAAQLRAPGIPLKNEFALRLAVEVADDAVTLTRVAENAGDAERFEVRWQLQPKRGGTQLRVALDAELSVPRLLPVGGLGRAFADGFASAAARELGAGAAA